MTPEPGSAGLESGGVANSPGLKKNANDLLSRGNNLFAERISLDTLWQDIAEQFYVERADFTVHRYIGEEFSDHLYSSYPPLVRRSLSDAFATMLRPRDKQWFRIGVHEEEKLSRSSKEWLEMATKRQRRAMYHTDTQFVRATKEGDADFATFGQCVLSRDIDWRAENGPSLLYRSWHLRDCAWVEKHNSNLGEIHRRWKPNVTDLVKTFGEKKLHRNVKNKVTSSPFQKVRCRVVVMPADDYHGSDKVDKPWTVVHIDEENSHIIHAMDVFSHGHTLPRWQTVSGSQYAYSPATVVGLPDARLIQAMSLTLLEAGEMAVRPPVVATQDAIREDVQWYPGGITWADVEYDERKGDVLRPINQDRAGLPFGLEVREQEKSSLAQAFYLDKITLPELGVEMTAFETAQRVEEYIRNAIPLFEPMETEYNGALCNDTFDIMMRMGAFGPIHEVPNELRGRDIEFQFESPLHDLIEKQKGSQFVESKQLIVEAMELDPSVVVNLDVHEALRDAIDGVGTPASWMRGKDEVEEIVDGMKQQQEAAQAAAVAEQAGAAAEQISKAESA